MRGMPNNLLPGEPFCSPRSTVLVESTIQLLRRLHHCDHWAPHINQYIHSQLELIGPLLKEEVLSHSSPGLHRETGMDVCIYVVDFVLFGGCFICISHVSLLRSDKDGDNTEGEM